MVTKVFSATSCCAVPGPSAGVFSYSTTYFICTALPQLVFRIYLADFLLEALCVCFCALKNWRLITPFGIALRNGPVLAVVTFQGPRWKFQKQKKISETIGDYEEQGWRSSESTRLQPMCNKDWNTAQRSYLINVNLKIIKSTLLQCNELNRGHPTLISQSHVTFTTKESGFGSL